jgi:hypothetical protein
MATRIPEPEPWCRVAAVLAEAAGESESPAFDAEAEAQAARLRGVRRDWCGRPCVTWSTAAELLTSLRAERARVLAAQEQRLVEADRAFRASLPSGIPAGMVPEGISAGQLMMLADPERQRARRQSVLEHSLEHPAGAVVYTSVGGES